MLKRLLTTVCPSLPSYRAAVRAGHWRDLVADARVVGWPAAARLWAGDWDRAAPPGRLHRVRPRGFPYPLFVRPGGSDPGVFRQVFVAREYAAVAGLPGVEFVVDCGANIGLTTAFLLHRYPRARAVVVEPDAGNMAVCRRNLAPVAGRVTFVQAGVWGAAGPLVVERGAYRDGLEWAVRVRPAAPGEPADVTAVTVPDLLTAGGFPRVDVLKMDIEGSEASVFRADAGRWLGLVRHLAIETHGPDCEAAVAAALAGFRFAAGTSGELAVYRDIARAGGPA